MMRRVLIVLLALMVLPSSTLIAEDDFYHAPGVSGCSVCHSFQDGSCRECDNIKGIRCSITIPNPGEGDTEREVVFTSRTGLNSFADRNDIYDGICQVCHTDTKHHTNDGNHSGHHAGDDCITCHKHANEFMTDHPQG
jgi:hypothetical protein